MSAGEPRRCGACKDEAVLRPPGLPVAILPTDVRTPLPAPPRCSRCAKPLEAEERILAVFVPDGAPQLVLYCCACEVAGFMARANPFVEPSPAG